MNEWIKVENRLPTSKDKMVLAYYSFHKDNMKVGVACVSGRKGTNFEWHSYQNRKIVKVTHWMPLPESPKDK